MALTAPIGEALTTTHILFSTLPSRMFGRRLVILYISSRGKFTFSRMYTLISSHGYMSMFSLAQDLIQSVTSGHELYAGETESSSTLKQSLTGG